MVPWASWLILPLAASCRDAIRQIDPVIVLLPWYKEVGRDVTVPITAYGGCYTWRVQRPDTAAVIPLASGGGCENRAHVSQRLRDPPKVSERTWVLASDQSSGSELKCEVHVATIRRLEIETRARNINVDTVETLTVKGYDDAGNVFSSLEGLTFKWVVEEPGILQEVPLQSDVYKATEKRKKLANEGHQSDVFLTKGLASGRSKVSVRLLEAGYPSGISAEVNLNVTEPVAVFPAQLIVPPHSRLKFTGRRLRPHVPLHASELVTGSLFEWSTDGHKWLSTDQKGTVRVDRPPALPTEFGLRLTDTRLALNQATADVKVVRPVAVDVLAFSVERLPRWHEGPDIAKLSYPKTELDKWFASLHSPQSEPPMPVPVFVNYFVLGREYIVVVQLRTPEGDLMYVPSNVSFQPKCESCPVNLRWESSNRAVARYQAVALGKGELRVNLDKIEDLQLGLVGSLAFTIVEPVSVTDHPASAMLPATSSVPVVLPPMHVWQLHPKGGSGSYMWKSTDSRIVTISPSGLMKAGSEAGCAQVIAIDRQNTDNVFAVDVVIAKVHHLSLSVDSAHITVQDHALVTAAALTDVNDAPDYWTVGKTVPFTACDRLDHLASPHWRGPSDGRFTLRVWSRDEVELTGLPPPAGACAAFRVKPRRTGHVKIRAALSKDEHVLLDERVQEVELTVHDKTALVIRESPLRLAPRDTYHFQEHLTLTAASVVVGSSFTVDLKGGPIKGFQHRWTVDNKFMSLTETPVSRTVQITCLSATEATQVLHTFLDDTGAPRDSSDLTVTCTVPVKVELAPMQADEVAPLSERTVFLQCGESVGFRMVGWDRSGQSMLGLGLLTPTWASSLPLHPSKDVSKPSVIKSSTSSCHGTHSVSMELRLNTNQKPFDLTHLVKPARNMVDDYYKRLRLPEEWKKAGRSSPFVLSDKLSVEVVPPAVVLTPETAVPRADSMHFFFHPDYVARILSVFGSGSAKLEGLCGDVRVVSEGSVVSSPPHPHKLNTRDSDDSFLFGVKRKLDPLANLSPETLSEMCRSVALSKERITMKSVPFSAQMPASYTEFIVRPQQACEVQAELVDNLLVGPGQQASSVRFTFQPLGSLTLRADGSSASNDLQLQLGSTLRVKISAFDVLGNELDASQFAAMGIVSKTTGDGLRLVTDPMDPSTLELEPLAHGQYRVMVQGTNVDRSVVTSEFLNVYVYLPLAVAHSKLILLPDEHSLELLVTGGPERLALSFSSDNIRSVEVNVESGLIHTKRIGRASVVVSGRSGSDHLSASVPVEVAWPSKLNCDFDGRGETGVLMQGNRSRLRVVPVNKAGEEFTLAHLPLPRGRSRLHSACVYSWTALDENLLLADGDVLTSSLSGAGMFSADVEAVASGNTSVKVDVVCGKFRETKTLSISVIPASPFSRPVLPAKPSSEIFLADALGRQLFLVPESRYALGVVSEKWRVNTDDTGCVSATSEAGGLVLRSNRQRCSSRITIHDDSRSYAYEYLVTVTPPAKVSVGSEPVAEHWSNSRFGGYLSLFDEYGHRMVFPTDMAFDVISSHHSLGAVMQSSSSLPGTFIVQTGPSSGCFSLAATVSRLHDSSLVCVSTKETSANVSGPTEAPRQRVQVSPPTQSALEPQTVLVVSTSLFCLALAFICYFRSSPPKEPEYEHVPFMEQSSRRYSPSQRVPVLDDFLHINDSAADFEPVEITPKSVGLTPASIARRSYQM